MSIFRAKWTSHTISFSTMYKKYSNLKSRLFRIINDVPHQKLRTKKKVIMRERLPSRQKNELNNVTAPPRREQKNKEAALHSAGARGGGASSGISYMDEKRVCRLR